MYGWATERVAQSCGQDGARAVVVFPVVDDDLDCFLGNFESGANFMVSAPRRCGKIAAVLSARKPQFPP